MRELLDRARADAGVEPVLPGLPERVQAVVRRGAEFSYLFLLNHGDGPARVAVATPAQDLLVNGARPAGDVSLPPRGVAVLRYPS
jgi:beta-galactosidase